MQCGVVVCVLVEGSAKTKSTERSSDKPRIDYRDVLKPDEFALFSRLRDVRKALLELVQKQVGDSEPRPLGSGECRLPDGRGSMNLFLHAC